jgi:restriction endonuclease S subunit
MARDWPHLPKFQSEDEARTSAQSDWAVAQIDSLYEKLDTGKLFDQKTSFARGRVPVLAQSADGVVGFHNENPGVNATPDVPVVTFANHTCEMRVMRRPFSVIQNIFPMVGKTGVCDTLFFYYATKGRVYLEEYKGHYPDYRRLWIPLPPLPEQRAIAHVLGTLDDLIELNRETNEILEEMARALFKSWFVDFDPVRAKLEGRPHAGMDAATAALFPDHFQDSELGQIPKGWEVGRFGDVCASSRQGVSPEQIDPETPYIGLEHMPRRSIALGEWETAAKVSSGKSAFNKGEILFGKLRPYFHKVGVAPVNGVCSTDILVLLPKQPAWFGFVLGHASSDALVQFADQSSAGTKMPRTNWKDLSSFKIVIPPQSVASAFSQILRSQVETIQESIFESRDLANLRDTLLPKLLSGEISAPAAEELIAAST